jgi:hypothetical protein
VTGKRPFYRTLYFQVLVAIALGILVGWLYPAFGASLKPLGDAFIRLVKMIITPVIFLTVTTGIAGMSDLKAFGRVGAKAMAYFLTFSTLALAVGLVVANVVRPGDGLNVDPASLDQGAVATYVDKAHDQSITGFLLDSRGRPVHERMPVADELHRQCGRDHRRGPVGESRGPRAAQGCAGRARRRVRGGGERLAPDRGAERRGTRLSVIPAEAGPRGDPPRLLESRSRLSPG